jgi:hypothetical protein
VTGSATTIDETTRQAAPWRSFRLPPISLNSLLAFVLIVSVVAWRTWAVLQWTFQDVDWRWIGSVQRIPLWQFITSHRLGHLQPAQFVIYSATTKFAPLNHFVAVIPLLVFSLASGWLMWRFLRALFGDRPGNLIPLAVFVLCPLTVPALVSLTFAYGIIPGQLFIIATLFAVLRYMRAPSAGRLAVVALAYAGGLVFWEKALLILPTAAFFVVLFLGEGEGWTRVRNVTLPRWRFWALLGGTTIVYIVLYLSTTASQQNNSPTALGIGRLIRRVFLTTLIPTFLGGPWSLRNWPVFGLFVGLPLAVSVLVLLTFAAIVASSLLLRRQAWRGWILALVYVVSCIAIVVTSNRFSILGSLIGGAARYFADCVPALAVGFALAFMVPLDRLGDPAWGRRPFAERIEPRIRAAIAAFRFQGGPATAAEGRLPRLTARTFAVGVVIAYTASALVTGTQMAAEGPERSARAWLANVKAELAANPNASIYDALLPRKAVASPVLLGDFVPLESRTLSLIAPKVRWNGTSDRMLVFDVGGRLRPARVVPGVVAHPGPVPGCGYRAGPNGYFVARVAPQLFPWQWALGLHYSTNADHDGFVTVDGDRERVRFHRGIHNLILIRHRTVGWVTVESQNQTVCVTRMMVGVIRPSTTG